MKTNSTPKVKEGQAAPSAAKETPDPVSISAQEVAPVSVAASTAVVDPVSEAPTRLVDTHSEVAAVAAPASRPGDPKKYERSDTWTPSQLKPKDIAEARDRAGEATNTYGNANRKKHNVREYTLGEEIANSVTHGLGAVLSLASIPVMVVIALGNGGGIYLFAALVYTITMVLEYTMSTLYHAIAVEKAKRVFKVLDHSCIYLFIAGSYTPFCLISLADSGGLWLCLFVWIVAFVGVAVEAFWVFRPRWISALLYLLMGWCVVWFVPALLAAIPQMGVWLLFAGGICYSAGCVFYVLKKIPYMHSIFHVWILAGSVFQFLAISLYVM